MVIDGSDVVGVTSGTVEVVGRAAEVASSVGTSGAVFAKGLACSSYGGTGGVTMGGTPGGVE